MGKTSFTIRKNEDGSVTFEYDNDVFDKEQIVDMSKSYMEHAKEVAIIRYNNSKELQLASIAASKEIANANKEAQIAMANSTKETIKELKVDKKAFSADDYIF